MPRIYMVRHGRIASQPLDPIDPELGADGRSQAHAVASELSTRLPKRLPIVISPLRRCRETAAPLSALWRSETVVESRLAEVPGPDPSVLDRQQWLRHALACDWPDLLRLGRSLTPGYDITLAKWRSDVLEAVLAYPTDVVMFSHFVPINVLVGHALHTERVAVCRPDNGSITLFETRARQIHLLERGREQPTRIS